MRHCHSPAPVGPTLALNVGLTLVPTLGRASDAMDDAAGRAEAAAARAEAAAARSEAAAARTEEAIERLERLMEELIRRETARRR